MGHARSLLAAAAACIAGLPSPGGSRAEAAPTRVKVFVVVLPERPDDVAGMARATAVGRPATLTLAGVGVSAWHTSDGGLMVGVMAGSEAGTRVSPGHPVPVHVARPNAPPLTLSLVFETSDGGWSYRVASALKIAVGAREITLVDADGDGSATGPGDGVLVADSALLVPLRLPLIAANARWTLNGCDLANPDAVPACEPLTDDPLADATLERVNRFRRTTGLPEVALDAKISAPCAMHHEYVKKNGWDPHGKAHEEEPGKPGYSIAGHGAAMASLLMSFDGPPAVEAWIRTHYHLAPFLVPGLERIGLATGAGFTVLDARTGVAAAPFWRTPYVRSPAPHEKDVHPAFWVGEEVPCPVPLCGKRGHAISVLAVPQTGGTTRPEGVTLRAGGAPPRHGRAEDVATLAPKTDLTGFYVLLGGAVPESPLAPGAYEASFLPSPGAPPIRWSFTVGFARDR